MIWSLICSSKAAKYHLIVRINDEKLLIISDVEDNKACSERTAFDEIPFVVEAYKGNNGVCLGLLMLKGSRGLRLINKLTLVRTCDLEFGREYEAGPTDTELVILEPEEVRG
ncbi:hypothetical protein SUGI_0998720 [Cryptomeria japonica]|nr:hypothetical protein SUGI_0998720 [Cryptomeria japonica]